MHIRGYEVDRSGYVLREVPIPVPIPYCGHGYGYIALGDGVYEVLKGAEDAFVIRKTLRRERNEYRPVG